MSRIDKLAMTKAHDLSLRKQMKISPSVKKVLDATEGHVYVRIRCRLNEAHLPSPYRESLTDMFSTYLMQTAKMALIVVPRKFVEEIAKWPVVTKITEIMTFE